MNQEVKNPLLCDPASGLCEIPAGDEKTQSVKLVADQKPVKILYYTDPICSTCWGIEPQLRKLKLEYGKYIDIEYRMGGLLPDWSYNSGGISKPSDVAHHWEEVSLHYDMPIDGDVWLEDPLDSSYPPSIAVKVAELQDKEKAVTFLRKLREFVFLEKKNITRWEHIQRAAVIVGLDTFQLREDFEGRGKQLFEEDLSYGRSLGVRGFPTLFFSDADNNQCMVYGFKPYDVFESAVRKVFPTARKQKIVIDSPFSLFTHYPTLTPKEYAVLAEVSVEEATGQLEKLVQEGRLEKHAIKTGTLYKVK